MFFGTTYSFKQLFLKDSYQTNTGTFLFLKNKPGYITIQWVYFVEIEYTFVFDQ